MPPIEQASRITQQRDVIARVLSYEFGLSEVGYKVNVSADPWSLVDPPCLVVAHTAQFADADEEGTFCSNVISFEIAMFVGPPGTKSALEQLDIWSEYLLRPNILAACVDDGLWQQGIPAPQVEQVGGAQLYDVGGPLLIGSLSTVRSEFHIN